MDSEVNCLGLIKGDEIYVFVYSDIYKTEILRTLDRFAENPELSFNWREAMILSQKVREMDSLPSTEDGDRECWENDT